MATLRLRYENGHFIPLEKVDDVQEGDVIEVMEWAPVAPSEIDDIQAMLDRTAGLWADWPEDVEGLVEDARKKWDEEWQERLKTLTDF